MGRARWPYGLVAVLVAGGLCACEGHIAGAGGGDGPGAHDQDASPGADGPPGDARPADDGGPGDGGPGDGAAGDAGELPPLSHQTFLIGYNEAWFGGNFGTDYSTAFDLDYEKKVFDGIVAAGGHLVRLFVFQMPQGITLGASPPLSQSVSADVLANVDATLTEARKRGLWVYLTILDACTIVKIVDPYHTWGLDILTNASGGRDAFNENALAPLLGVVDAHQEGIFGIDIINEIQAAMQNGVFADSWNDARAFLAAEAAFIKTNLPWVRVTATAGWPSDILQTGAQYDIANGLYTGLGLDFYDLHAYYDSGSYTGATAMCNRALLDGVPIYLGEFGQKTHSEDDTLQYNATAAFLNNSIGLCFKGAFAWRYDPAEAWLHYMRADWTPRPAVTAMQAFGGLP